MKALLWLSALLALNSAEEFYKYDAAAIKRFDDELRRLGAVLPPVSMPGEPTSTPDPTVSSKAGDFEGYWTKSQFGRPIAAFEGIPYAQPPIGKLRFKLAEPLTRKLLNFRAKQPGSQCPQSDMVGTNPGVQGNEDCLFLNVYAPEKTDRSKSELLPVMFYVPGGGFMVEKGHSYQCNVLLDKDIVLITINYRLGALGFLTTEDGVIPGNLGLKDQVRALKWVHENIGAFGGDPNLITVFGQSAGGASTEFLMLSPLTKGLISRVIASSGSVFAPWATAPPGEMRRHVQKTAQHLNCPLESSEKLLACLQTKTPEEIIDVHLQFQLWETTPVIPFKPVIEGDIPGAHIPYHPAKLYADGLNNDVPFLTGITSGEGLFLTPIMFENDTIISEFDKNFEKYITETLLVTGPNEKNTKVIDSLRRAYFTPGSLNKANVLEIADLYTDVYFLWPAMKTTKLNRKRADGSAFFYYFSFEGSRSFLPYSGPTTNYGVAHGDDFLYLFNYTNVEVPPPTASDVLMSMVWTDLFTSFARDGVPSSNLLNSKWLPFTTQGPDFDYLHIKSPRDITMQKNLLPLRWTLLNRLFETDHRQDGL